MAPPSWHHEVPAVCHCAHDACVLGARSALGMSKSAVISRKERVVRILHLSWIMMRDDTPAVFAEDLRAPIVITTALVVIAALFFLVATQVA